MFSVYHARARLSYWVFSTRSLFVIIGKTSITDKWTLPHFHWVDQSKKKKKKNRALQMNTIFCETSSSRLVIFQIWIQKHASLDVFLFEYVQGFLPSDYLKTVKDRTFHVQRHVKDVFVSIDWLKRPIFF